MMGPVAVMIEQRVPILGWCAAADDRWRCPDMRCPFPILHDMPYGCLVLVQQLSTGQVLRPGREDRYPDLDTMHVDVLREMQEDWDRRYAKLASRDIPS
jgi:hypothetical protein